MQKQRTKTRRKEALTTILVNPGRKAEPRKRAQTTIIVNPESKVTRSTIMITATVTIRDLTRRRRTLAATKRRRPNQASSRTLINPSVIAKMKSISSTASSRRKRRRATIGRRAAARRTTEGLLETEHPRAAREVEVAATVIHLSSLLSSRPMNPPTKTAWKNVLNIFTTIATTATTIQMSTITNRRVRRAARRQRGPRTLLASATIPRPPSHQSGRFDIANSNHPANMPIVRASLPNPATMPIVRPSPPKSQSLESHRNLPKVAVAVAAMISLRATLLTAIRVMASKNMFLREAIAPMEVMEVGMAFLAHLPTCVGYATSTTTKGPSESVSMPASPASAVFTTLYHHRRPTQTILLPIVTRT